MHPRPVHHAVEMHRKQRRCPYQIAVRGNHVQPVRKQHVDLVNMRLQNRIAGLVVLVERRPQSLILVQHQFRGAQLRLPARRPRRRLFRQLRLPLLQSLHIVLLGRQQQLRQVLLRQHAEEKDRQHNR